MMINKLNYKLAKRGSKFFIKNIEEKTILAIFAKVKIGEALTLGDKLVLEAFNRYSSSLSDPETLKNYLSGMSEESLIGVASNVKGILHEIQFAAIENNNFDSVYASLYETTNHPGYDVRMYDESTGEEWDIQLKATDDTEYVDDWIENHDGEIKVTEELAQKEGFESSGISNEELTQRVEKLETAAKLQSMQESVKKTEVKPSQKGFKFFIFLLFVAGISYFLYRFKIDLSILKEISRDFLAILGR